MSKAKFKKPKWIFEIKAVGWDLDGTLYASGELLKKEIDERRLKAVMDKNNWERKKTIEEYSKFFSKLHSNTKTLTAMGVDGVDFFVRLWDELPLEKYLKKDKKLSMLFGRLVNKRHFLLSNSNRVDQIERKLGLIGLDASVFEFLLSTVDVGAVKPDPKPFLVALDRLKLESKQVLYIGDRVSTDIMGAGGVGVRTCLVWGKSKEADVSLPTVYDVVKLFNI